MWPDVSVIIPYYDNPEGLREVLAAVRAQDYQGRVEIIIADDGSPTPASQEPSLADALSNVVLVRQDDLGFRAAAARNLGAAAATGEVFAFIDGDTVPQPGYLTAAVAHVQRNRRAVIVGKRLTGPGLTEPRWLTDAWAATGNMSRADSTSWRYVISAVLTCSANFFRHIGGFDADFVGYGGEDWEFGWRAWNAGAQLVHEPGAVAHHPEEDFGGRHRDVAEETRVKNIETLALARRITHPIARPAGVVFDMADVAIVVPEFDQPGAAEAVIASWLRIDAHVYAPEKSALFASDPRVSTGPPGAERIRVTLTEAWALADAEMFYRRATDRFFQLPDGTEVATARALALTSPRTRASGAWLGLAFLDDPQRLERVFAGW
ncbi:glycosyltransferase [Corynebacterium qintianiae]|uniref:Glycosyltransferase n=1 Tax=Corynebacterium qintianiae TaxID=2709392 RepID=A0A7T0PFJ0_9CORY|nr:glycosyltransferase [Corynebacterium qintianiae]QPK82877.1 glycosyltransferase [Corynebacterium qintianiae]